MKTEIIVVDNKTFVLGLDELYREAVKYYERTELLNHAKTLAELLNLEPLNCPIEGYYYEEPELTEYFKLIRAIQEVPIENLDIVKKEESYKRLYQIVTSPIFGNDFDKGKLLPRSSNPFNVSLKKTFPNWNMQTITQEAYQLAGQSNDFSLVTLGVLTKDPIVITALRESLALYMAAVAAGIPEPVQYKYEWRVDSEIEKRAKLFVSEFNSLFNNELPLPCEKNAETYYYACKTEGLFGRCINLGNNNNPSNMQFYHWAIKFNSDYNLEACEFWDSKIVTTQEFREQHCE